MPWKLLWRNVLGHPVRSLLTIGAVTVAVFLITVLQAVTAGLSRTLDASSANRLLVQSAVSLYVDLPLSYQQKMASVDGIEAICKWQWFGGRYEQDKGGFFPQFAIDPETFMVSYPEMSIAAGSYEDFASTRTASATQSAAKEEVRRHHLSLCTWTTRGRFFLAAPNAEDGKDCG